MLNFFKTCVLRSQQLHNNKKILLKVNEEKPIGEQSFSSK